jgi:hypothetical protein
VSLKFYCQHSKIFSGQIKFTLYFIKLHDEFKSFEEYFGGQAGRSTKVLFKFQYTAEHPTTTFKSFVAILRKMYFSDIKRIIDRSSNTLINGQICQNKFQLYVGILPASPATHSTV